ncbi:hypothetical protein MKY98_06165 [Paenibacillus sp. FSL M8-0228]|jgi:hypothetical protein|uniref:Uncharacterized protein n=1 Tax=Paenibacillus polymyxa TaxID=1406 RepID=A0A8I1IP16_PAEPO|nr:MULTISPECIES: hypothetical protein [Paenibacillus]KAF6576451.1 hypothetical protein G9G53_00660 [Paenibacillus sp. EKM206P]KAF6591415.1 hypothetical protein G9G52_03305 [Paenibacillus sp. EKM205P]MBM0632107.1 hypothetical protein [Paenibacillus polymyxa]MBO3283580.1 hypothetical protein [Paenibacillus polymyxa]
MSISLRIERKSGGEPIEFVKGEITGFTYKNNSSLNLSAKSTNLVHSLHILSKIPLHSLPSVIDNADNSNMLYTWANTEYEPDTEDYYRKCNIQIVRNENTIRDITFTHAYVHEYQEQIDTSKEILEFELVLKQKEDQLGKIQYSPQLELKETREKEQSDVSEKVLEDAYSKNMLVYAGSNTFPFENPMVELEKTWVRGVEKVKNSSDTVLHYPDRKAFTLVAVPIARKKYGDITANLLQHSLDYNPGNLHFNEWSYEAQQIKKSKEHIAIVNDEVKKANANKAKSFSNNESKGLESDKDLYNAFHKMYYKINGNYVDGQWKITTIYYDKYNFEYNFKQMFTGNNKLGWAAANLTNLMESWGTLNEYTSYVTVTDTRKAWK